MSDLRALLAAVREHLPELRERSEQAHYGYCVVESPHDFTPDLETNTPEEIANHRAACEAWDRGERGVTPLGCGNLPRMDGWGLGGQTLRDPAVTAVVALLDALLASPSVLDAYEAVRALGVARGQREAASFPSGMGDGGVSARQDAGQAMRRALGAIDELADRLAKGGA